MQLVNQFRQLTKLSTIKIESQKILHITLHKLHLTFYS